MSSTQQQVEPILIYTHLLAFQMKAHGTMNKDNLNRKTQKVCPLQICNQGLGEWIECIKTAHSSLSYHY
jgi:hypothetical protein